MCITKKRKKIRVHEKDMKSNVKTGSSRVKSKKELYLIEKRKLTSETTWSRTQPNYKLQRVGLQGVKPVGLTKRQKRTQIK